MSHCLSACLPGSNKDLGAASHDPYRPVSACAFCQPTTPTCSGASLSHVSLALGCLFLFLLFYSQPHLRMPSPCLPQASVYQGNLRTPLQITLRCFNSSAHCILLSTQGTSVASHLENAFYFLKVLRAIPMNVDHIYQLPLPPTLDNAPCHLPPTIRSF